MLSDTGSIDTTGLGILGGATAQVSVEFPVASEDERLVDDDVVGDEYSPDERVRRSKREADEPTRPLSGETSTRPQCDEQPDDVTLPRTWRIADATMSRLRRRIVRRATTRAERRESAAARRSPAPRPTR